MSHMRHGFGTSGWFGSRVGLGLGCRRRRGGNRNSRVVCFGLRGEARNWTRKLQSGNTLEGGLWQACGVVNRTIPAMKTILAISLFVATLIQSHAQGFGQTTPPPPPPRPLRRPPEAGLPPGCSARKARVISLRRRRVSPGHPGIRSSARRSRQRHLPARRGLPQNGPTRGSQGPIRPDPPRVSRHGAIDRAEPRLVVWR